MTHQSRLSAAPLGVSLISGGFALLNPRDIAVDIPRDTPGCNVDRENVVNTLVDGSRDRGSAPPYFFVYRRFRKSVYSERSVEMGALALDGRNWGKDTTVVAPLVELARVAAAGALPLMDDRRRCGGSGMTVAAGPAVLASTVSTSVTPLAIGARLPMGAGPGVPHKPNCWRKLRSSPSTFASYAANALHAMK